MELTPVTYLIVLPLVFLAGFVDSVAGGGGIISLHDAQCSECRTKTKR